MLFLTDGVRYNITVPITEESHLFNINNIKIFYDVPYDIPKLLPIIIDYSFEYFSNKKSH
jgi:hypothetical protein